MSLELGPQWMSQLGHLLTSTGFCQSTPLSPALLLLPWRVLHARRTRLRWISSLYLYPFHSRMLPSVVMSPVCPLSFGVSSLRLLLLLLFFHFLFCAFVSLHFAILLYKSILYQVVTSPRPFAGPRLPADANNAPTAASTEP